MLNSTIRLHFNRAFSAHPIAVTSATIRPKVTLQTLQKLYRNGEKIAVITAHDYPSGIWAEKAAMDIVLVGDSLAMVALGHTSTTQITLSEMLHHSKAVGRGSKTPFLVGDLPFGTYEKNKEWVRILLMTGIEMAETVHAITSIGIPVLAHIGLTPQRATNLSGFKAQGRTLSKAQALIEDAISMQQAGAFAVVLEAVPELVATAITRILKIPTIGIGAGGGCSGQVLVQMDALGVYESAPKFCKMFAQVGSKSVEGLREYTKEVKSGSFPISGSNTYKMRNGEDLLFNEWLATQTHYKLK